MLQFIVTNIFFLSLGVILYVAVRTLPRIDGSIAPERKGAWERWLASGVPERIDRALNGFLFKALRRLKVLLLRADNALNARLQKIKPGSETSNARGRENKMFEVLLPGKPNGNGAQKQNIDFKAIKEENKESVE